MLTFIMCVLVYLFIFIAICLNLECYCTINGIRVSAIAWQEFLVKETRGVDGMTNLT